MVNVSRVIKHERKYLSCETEAKWGKIKEQYVPQYRSLDIKHEVAGKCGKASGLLHNVNPAASVDASIIWFYDLL